MTPKQLTAVIASQVKFDSSDEHTISLKIKHSIEAVGYADVVVFSNSPLEQFAEMVRVF